MPHFNLSTLIRKPDGFAPMDYSASVAEIGKDAGRSTWVNAIDCATDNPEVLQFTRNNLDTLRSYFRDFGAWDDDEIAAWDEEVIGAMVVQEIAHNLREAFDVRYTEDVQGLTDDDWTDYEARASEGSAPWMFWRDDAGDVQASFER